MLRQIVYTSVVARTVSTEDVRLLVRGARAFNLLNNITGLLWFDGNHFVQVLEGEPAQLELAMERIRKDPRHQDITIVRDDEIPKREFEDWAMAYNHPDSKEFYRGLIESQLHGVGFVTQFEFLNLVNDQDNV